MLQVTELSGFAAGRGLQVKGYGSAIAANTSTNLTLTYGSVTAGLAPAAGDLVVWMIYTHDAGGQSIVDVTGSGWAQSRVSSAFTTNFRASILGKVVTAGDISSPANIVTAPTNGGAMGVWVCYSGNSSSPSLSVPSLAANDNADSIPTLSPVNAAGAAGVAVIMTYGTGSDDSPALTWSGAVEDFSISANNVSGSANDIIFKVATIPGGANVTITKPDDGSNNAIAGGYLLIA